MNSEEEGRKGETVESEGAYEVSSRCRLLLRYCWSLFASGNESKDQRHVEVESFQRHATYKESICSKRIIYVIVMYLDCYSVDSLEI